METKRIAVVGYGGRGGIYGEFALQFPEKFQLVAVADINEMRLKRLEGENVDVYTDYKKLLDAGYELDLVAIATHILVALSIKGQEMRWKREEYQLDRLSALLMLGGERCVLPV